MLETVHLKAEKYKGEIKSKKLLVVAGEINYFLGMFELDLFENFIYLLSGKVSM